MSLILLADDDDFLVEYMRACLTENGHDVLTCSGGAAAIDLAGRESPDAIVLDAMMPRIDGYQVLWHLKHQPGTQNIPVMMLTSRSSPRDEAFGLSLGAEEYVFKPFSTEEVIDRIENLIRAHPHLDVSPQAAEHA